MRAWSGIQGLWFFYFQNREQRIKFFTNYVLEKSCACNYPLAQINFSSCCMYTVKTFLSDTEILKLQINKVSYWPVVVPQGGLGGLVPSKSQKSANLVKEKWHKIVGYTFRLENYVKISPPPFLSDFSDLAPPLLQATSPIKGGISHGMVLSKSMLFQH